VHTTSSDGRTAKEVELWADLPDDGSEDLRRARTEEEQSWTELASAAAEVEGSRRRSRFQRIETDGRC